MPIKSANLFNSRQAQTPRIRSGFTLIELLVVISIIALLVGILLPALGAARKSAMNLECKAREKQILTAIMVYTGDNEEHYPAGKKVPGSDITWDDQLGDYLGASLSDVQKSAQYVLTSDPGTSPTSFYKCPMDDLLTEDIWGSFGSQVYRRSYILAWGHDPNGSTASQRQWAPGIVHGANQYADGNTRPWSARESELTKSSGTIVMSEFSNNINVAGWGNTSILGPGEQLNRRSPLGRTMTWHHDDKPNYGFGDGHVEQIAVEETLLEETGYPYLDTMWDYLR